jgi:hypothetical protein
MRRVSGARSLQEKAARRAETYRMHEEGWAGQMKSIEQCLAKAA